MASSPKGAAKLHKRGSPLQHQSLELDNTKEAQLKQAKQALDEKKLRDQLRQEEANRKAARGAPLLINSNSGSKGLAGPSEHDQLKQVPGQHGNKQAWFSRKTSPSPQ